MIQCDTINYNVLQVINMATINARISEELDKSLAMLAQSLDRSKSYIVNKALESYIREHLEDLEDAKIALARVKNPNRVSLNSNEMRSRILARTKNV